MELNKTYITNKGRALMAKVGTGTRAQFSKLKISSKTYPDATQVEVFEEIATLPEVKQEVSISDIVYRDKVYVDIKAAVSNKGLATGYKIGCLGFYALDPDDGEILYAIAPVKEGTADWFPADNGKNASSLEVSLTLEVGNSANVNMLVDAGAYATVSMMNDVKSELASIKDFIGLDDTIYGVEVDLPNRTYTRLGGAKNLLPGADFDSIGPWKRRRCIMTTDGVVLAYYGEENYKDYRGLTTIEIEKNGKVYPINTRVQDMVEQPKFYYKIIPKNLEPADGGGYHMRRFRVYISPTNKQGFKVHPAFIRDGRELDCIYLAVYQSDLVNVVDYETGVGYYWLYSYGGGYAHTYLARGLMRKYAEAVGKGWQLRDAFTKGATTLLFLVEYNTLRTDGIGPGNVKGPRQKNGLTFNLGNASGSDKETGVATYRGEENLWGNSEEWIDGLNITVVNDKIEIYYAHEGFADSIDGAPYTKVNGTLPNNYGYISAFLYTGDNDTDTMFLPSEALGNSNLLRDNYYIPPWTGADGRGWRSVYVNGGLSERNGLSYFGVTSPMGNGVKCATRLMYIPSKEEPTT